MAINVGEKLPEFKLKDQQGNKVSLDDFSGKNVLLSFHPLAWTSVCAKQMKALDDNYQEFSKFNTVPLGFSVDPVPSKKAWAKDLAISDLKMPSDFWPHGEFANKLGIFIADKGISGRVNILVNDKGEVLWVKEYDIPELPDIDEVLKAVKENA